MKNTHFTTTGSIVTEPLGIGIDPIRPSLHNIPWWCVIKHSSHNHFYPQVQLSYERLQYHTPPHTHMTLRGLRLEIFVVSLGTVVQRFI